MKYLTNTMLLLLSLLTLGVSAQQDPSGSWRGELEIAPGNKLNVEFILQKNGDGSWAALINTPDSPAINKIPAAKVKLEGDKIALEFPTLSGSYVGAFGAGKLQGQWTQAGASMPLNLSSYTAPVLADTELDRLAGEYSPYAGAKQKIVVSFEDSVLYVLPPGQQVKQRLVRNEEGEGVLFRFENQPVTLRFSTNEQGVFASFKVSPNGRPGPTLTRVEVLEAEYKKVAKTLRPNGLSDAVLMNDPASAKALIAAGIDLQELDTRPGIGGDNGRRPLNHAALQNNPEMIDLLLAAGADINATNKSGFTPLHHAAEANAAEAAKLLLAKGVDISIKTERGMTALDIASFGERTEVLAILKPAYGDTE